jgi:hypothetical protein
MSQFSSNYPSPSFNKIEPLNVKVEKRLHSNWDEKVIIITIISSIISTIVSTLLIFSLLK